MKYQQLAIGLLLGIITSFLGAFIFLKLFTTYHPISDIAFIKQQGLLGKIITLGTVLNIGLVFILLKKSKDLMARGVILSIIVLTIFTLFI